MQIGIDCLRINPSYLGGVNTYTLGLLDGFASLENGLRYRLYVTSRNQHLFSKYVSLPHFRKVVMDDRSLLVRRSMSRMALLSQSGEFYKFVSNLAFANVREMMDAETDLIYTPTVVLQSFNSRKPTVLSMHDIQHVHYPEFFSWPRMLSRRITYGLSARYANYFQASSQFIHQDLLAHFKEIAPGQVEVIPEGVNVADFSTRSNAEARLERYHLPERFLLYPAQLWPHKNHMTVLKALKRIETGYGLEIPLILTGARYSAAPEILGFIARQSMGYVFYLGKIPFLDLVALYQKAVFLISAALYESSSLPILEAAAAGIPVIASRIPPNEELGRVLRLNLFTPTDEEDLAQLVYKLWNDEKTPSAQAAHNQGHVGLYSWENTARKYAKFFERIGNS
jgi:glycosyltransferase involved in cell wall biosynthesis